MTGTAEAPCSACDSRNGFRSISFRDRDRDKDRDGHAGVGPGSNTAKPEKERETEPPKLDGPEEAREAGIHSGASSPPTDPYYLKVLCRHQR